MLSYNLNAPMSLKDFDALPQDLKKEYITGLTVKYNVGVRRLADMMGVSAASLGRRLRPLGYDTSVSRWQTYDERAAWETFLGSKQVVAETLPETLPETVSSPAERPTPSETPEASPEDIPVAPSADIAEAAAPASLLRNGSLSFAGNAEAVLEELGAVLRGCGSVKLRVSFEVSNDVE